MTLKEQITRSISVAVLTVLVSRGLDIAVKAAKRRIFGC
jgi:hypothetical protein